MLGSAIQEIRNVVKKLVVALSRMEDTCKGR